MARELCLISPCDITREGIARIISSEGFEVVASIDESMSFPFGDLSAETVFLIDSPESVKPCELVERLKAECEAPIVIVLDAGFDLQMMLDCFRAGARGYIIKSLKAAPLIAAIKLAVSGERVLPSDVLNLFEAHSRPIPSLPDVVADVEDANLSPREHDVLCCLMAGYSNKVIARELDVCEATVKVHVKAILRKLNVNNRTQAAIWASSHSAMAGFLPWHSSRYSPTARAS